MVKTKYFMKKAMTVTLIALTAVSTSASFLGTNQSISAAAYGLNVYEAKGWLESASVKWTPIKEATEYRVYYKEASADDSNYKQIDSELIRMYSNYCRADVVGLRAGTYVMKVVPIIDGQESLNGIVTKTVTVQEQVREGFAFSKNSTMGTGSGGYNDDGTVPENAQIIYITADTVNTVTLDVITNSKGSKTTCTGLVDIFAKRQKGYDKRPLIIRVIGTIRNTDINGLNSSGYLQLKGCYNVTLEGIGEDATIYGWGILVRNARNIEIRNLGLMLFPDDGISLDTDNENIWIHNNDIFYGAAGSDADQVKGDGSCDVKGYSTNVTISYNHFYDSGKSSLCGMSDSEEFFVTYHHNWFDHSDSRHPRIRVGTIHIYNNYFDGNSKYGVGVTKGSSAFVEANYFRNCKYPMLSSLQGTDIYGGSKGTFSGEAGGMIKAYNNIILGESRLVYANEDSKQFDAYLATSREETVPSSYQTVSGGTTYNNFDTNENVMYEYNPTSPELVETNVTSYSGRINGGDFNFEFNDAVDDTSSSVNKELMAAFLAYQTDLVTVGGDSIIIDSDIELPTPTPDPEEPGDVVTPTPDPEEPGDVVTPTPDTEQPEQTKYEHNFTLDSKASDYFTIKGSLSTSKGNVNYNGMTLTQCLKMESATKITFQSEKEAEILLVFNDNCNKKILIDGAVYSVVNGSLEVTLSAGEHSIMKEDSNMNLYYMLLTEN